MNSWAELMRIAVLGSLSYVALVVLLRVSGKRTLSKMNAFDLVITVAMGSTFATILLSSDVELAEGVTALSLLVLLQLAVTWTSLRSPLMRRLVKSEPTLLFQDGRFLRRALVSERVTEDEVVAAMRSQGMPRVAAVAAVVLETDGTLSVIGRDGFDSSILHAVRGQHNGE